MLPQRNLQCEEYSRLTVGSELDGITLSELKRVEATWLAVTGKKPSGFFEYGAGFVRPKNWAGTIAVPGLTIQVVPRGARALSPQDKSILDKNLNQMLRTALSKRVVATYDTNLIENESRLDSAIEALCDLVLLARRRRILRSYQMRHETTRSCRGRILFPYQIKNEVSRPGLFSSSWVDLGEDNPENRFLRASLHFCKQRSSGRIRRRIEEILVDFAAVSVTGSPLDEYRRIRFERLPKEYYDAISLAKSLLDGNGGGLFAGSLTSRAEVIFMPDLFQTFVGYLSREVANDINCNMLLQRKGRYLGQWETGPRQGLSSFEVVPDIELERLGSEQPAFLLDAKWKTIRPEARDLGVNEDDVYQMIAYSRRFNCERAILVYPWIGHRSPFSGRPPMISIDNKSQTTIKLAIVCIPLLWDQPAEIPEWIHAAMDVLMTT